MAKNQGLGKAWRGVLHDTPRYKDMKAEGWASVRDVYDIKRGVGWTYSTTYRKLREMVASGKLEFRTVYGAGGHRIGVYRPKGA